MDYEISWLDDVGKPFLYDDGVGDATDPFVRGLMNGTVVLYGDSYTVRWLDGAELKEAARIMGVPR